MSSVGRTTAPPGVVRRGMRLLAQCIREEPKPFIVSVFGAALYGGMTLASALVFGEITDRVIVPAFAEGGEGVTPAAVALAALVLATVALIKSAGIILRRAGASLMQYRLQARYRERVAHQYQQLPLSWHRHHPTGELLSHASSDVEAAFWPLAPLPFACGVILLLLGSGIALVMTDPFLAVVGFAVGPALAFLNWRSNRALQEPAMRAQERRAAVSAVAHESFDGALVVKTLGREAAETDRFRQVAEQLRDDLVQYGRRRARFDPLMDALPNIGVLVLILVGVWRLERGLLSSGDLVAFAYLFTLLAFPIRAIGWVLAELPKAVVGWERVRGVLDASGSMAFGGGHLAVAVPPPQRQSRCASPTTTTTCSTTSRSPSSRAAPWPSSAPRGRGSPPSPGCWSAWPIPPTAPSGWMIETCESWQPDSCRVTRRSCSRNRSCSTAASATT